MKRPSGSKNGSLSVGTGLKLPSSGQMTKTIKFGENSYRARHVIVPAEQVESKTVAHYLNTRHQETLTMDAVRDIYPETLADGIKQEGVAYFNKELDRYELFDASRRRFCAIQAVKDLPLWVIDELPNAKDIAAYVELTQKVKLYSWREVGTRYLNYADEQTINANDFERIGKAFAVSAETARKKIKAAQLNSMLVQSFPDCQGIPTSFYAKLGKIERILAKSNVSVELFVSNELATFNTNATDVEDIQAELLAHYEEKIKGFETAKTNPVSKSEDLAEFADKDTYARMKISGRKMTLEFSRIPKEILSEIEEYVRQKLAEKP